MQGFDDDDVVETGHVRGLRVFVVGRGRGGGRVGEKEGKGKEGGNGGMGEEGMGGWVVYKEATGDDGV